MRILGIDPGIAIVGFGLIESNRGSVRMLQYGAVTTEAGLSVLPIFPSTVAMCIMSASTTASSTAACLIILLENYVSARCAG